MKKIISILISVLFSSAVLNAQSLDDAIRFSQTYITGTARSAAMGNAFGALGGDFASLSINPAGIAIYRSSEVSITPSFVFNNTTSSYAGTVREDNENCFPFNQAGVVFTYKQLNDDAKGIISTHFAFGYNRVSNFNQNTTIEGYAMESSKLSQFVLDAEGNYPDQLDEFGSALAFNTWLLDTLPGIGNSYFNAFEGIAPNGDIIWRATNGLDQRRLTIKDGYAGEYNFSFGINISNTIMLGATMGIENLRYEENSTYSEFNTYGLTPAFNTDLDYYDYNTYLDQRGTGVNFKFGIIAKPFQALRLGAAISTPTYYNIWDRWTSSMVAYYKDDAIFKELSPYGEYNYKYRTPMKATASAAFVMGKYMILSVDYEFDNYKSTQFKPVSYSDDYLRQLNAEIDQKFKNTSNIRAGLEFKPMPAIGIRGGFSYQDSPYKEEYENEKSTFLTYSGGVGFRTARFFVDLAYLQINRQYDFYNYNWDPGWDDAMGTPEPARIKSVDNQIILSLGFRF